jgi:hypothetical protein
MEFKSLFFLCAFAPLRETYSPAKAQRRKEEKARASFI